MRRWYFVTHPNVVVDATIPVPRWPLSPRGIERMRAGLHLPWVREVTALHCSTEQKAIDGAAIWADHLGMTYTCHEDLARRAISRQWDQPAHGGGNWYAFTIDPPAALSPWQPIDATESS